MKTLLNLSVLALLFISLFSCTSESNNTIITDTNSFDARFVNESVLPVDVIVYDVNGKVTENSTNVNPGESFDISEMSAGETTFRIITQNSDRISVIDTDTTHNYYLVLNEDLSVSTIQSRS